MFDFKSNGWIATALVYVSLFGLIGWVVYITRSELPLVFLTLLLIGNKPTTDN